MRTQVLMFSFSSAWTSFRSLRYRSWSPVWNINIEHTHTSVSFKIVLFVNNKNIWQQFYSTWKIINSAQNKRKYKIVLCSVCTVFSFVMSSVFLFRWGPLIFVLLLSYQVWEVSSVVLLHSSVRARHLVLRIRWPNRCLEAAWWLSSVGILSLYRRLLVSLMPLSQHQCHRIKSPQKTWPIEQATFIHFS